MPARPFAALAFLTCSVFFSCEQAIETPRIAAREPTRGGEIGFELARPGEAAILVPVKINGEGPFPFVLDTGATLTCVGDHLATQLDLPASRGMRGIGASVGGSGSIKLVDLDSVTIGDATVENVTACSIDLANVRDIGVEADGLLGLNVLKRFDVAIDFDRQILRLTKPSTE